MDNNSFPILFSLLFLLGGLLHLQVSDATVRCIETERQALLRVKQDFYDKYDILSSWGSGEDAIECCNWWGVKCSNVTGHVIALDLHADHNEYDRILKGKLSRSLAKLNHLSYLDLSYNDFGNYRTGRVIGSLYKLTYLNLDWTYIKGILADQLGNLTSLQTLFLHGCVPETKNFEWLSKLQFLQNLDLSGMSMNTVTNSLQVIFNLPNLEELYLNGCDIGLSVTASPLVLLHNSSFSILSLSSNGLTAYSTYYWLFNVSKNLVRLDLSDNHLGGPIPNCFGEMTSLEDINLSFNFLHGKIPFSNLSQLCSLDLSYNRNLSEPFPKLLQKLSRSAKSLEILDLSLNRFYGPLVHSTQFSSLTSLLLSSNQLTKLPSDLKAFPSLTQLNLRNNRLRGSIHKSMGQLFRLEILDLEANFLEGTISEVHFSGLSCLKELHLSYNSLTLNVSREWVPVFQLEVIRLSNCSMGPHFPEWLRTQSNFSELDLSFAGILDTLPNWFWDLSPSLSFLNLSNNGISGDNLPAFSKFFHGFPQIDLSSNNFSGQILSSHKNKYLHKNKYSHKNKY